MVNGELNRFGVVDPLIPLKILDKEHNRPVCCGHTFVLFVCLSVYVFVCTISNGSNQDQAK